MQKQTMAGTPTQTAEYKKLTQTLAG